jgi:4-hydroxy-2-oxovalerate/4-hydroxy-2-oxohexanoate aldolase
MNFEGRHITLHDMCLRDGMHPKQHQITVDEMVDIAGALDAAGVPLIEVTHGDGLGGASVNYGFPAASDETYLRAVVERVEHSAISALLLPGIGTVDHLRMAADCGVKTIRVATHCTEANVSRQHINLSRDLGLDTVGFLMMAHMISEDALVEQALLMESYGANCIYCTDSAGYMLPQDVTDRIALLKQRLKSDTEVGFHGHHNLAMGVANSLAAIAAGANRIDGSAAGLGAGAGNTPLEAMAAVLERMGAVTWRRHFQTGRRGRGPCPTDHGRTRPTEPGCARYWAMPAPTRPFCCSPKRAQEKYGVPSHEILLEMARRKTVGGQEDLIEEIAIEMAAQTR